MNLLFLLLLLGLWPLAAVFTPPLKPTGCLDRKQAAGYLSISTRLLDNLAGQGDIPRVKIGTKTLFRVSDLDAYVATKVQRLKPGV